MFFIKLTPRENTKLLNYCVIIKSTTLSHPPSIILINRRTNPKLIPNQWASLNYEFENSISRGRASHHFFANGESSIPKTSFLTYLNPFPLKSKRWTVKK